MSILDRLLGRKPTARRSFDATTGGRRGSSFRHFGTTSTETMAAAGPLRSRARHAAANSGWIANGVAAIVAEAAGAGIEPSSEHAPIWDEWTARADAAARTDARGLVAAMVRACVIDGEAFGVIEVDGSVRQIPAEMVDESMTRDLGNGAYVVSGIEFNAEGRRVAYHILPHMPTDAFPTAAPAIRFPASDVIHLFRPLGPGQVRGVSWLAPVLLTLNELDQLQDALLVGAKVAAMFAGFIVDQNDLGGGSDLAADLQAIEDAGGLTPGGLYPLSGGRDVKFTAPEAARDSIAHAKLTLGQIAAGLGVPQHMLDGDLSNANYSSLRAGLIPFRQKIEQFQYHCLVPQVLNPLWGRVMTDAYLSGRLEAFAPRTEWLMPRPMQVDPMKDTQALIAQIDAGLTSRTQAVATLGWNAAQLDAEIAADRAREADLNLSFGAEK